MIPEKTDNFVETNLKDSKTIKFKFEADRHLFAAVSQNLYSYPCDSMVREVISNAVDANTRAGKDHSALIIILNDNEFIVQDQGEGISEFKMENVVGVYGKSDKRETNEEIGMYGFGFKSPFAVADQFITETVFQNPENELNTKHIWIIYKDVSGSGEIKLVSQMETDDPTGTKIRVPIPKAKAYEIKTAIRRYINFMNPQPTVYLPNNEMVKRSEITAETDEWLTSKVQSQYNILYDGWMPYRYEHNIPKNLIIKIKKDELRFSPSREQIKETEEFKKIFIEKAEKYWQQFLEIEEKKIQQETDPIKIRDLCSGIFTAYANNFGKNKDVCIANHPVYGDFIYPTSFNFNVIRHANHKFRIKNRFGRENLIQQPLENSIFYYMPDAEFNKIYTGYYTQKINKIYLNHPSKTLLIIKESDKTCVYHPIVIDIIKHAKNLKDIKVYRSGSGGTKTKYRKNHITVSTVDGTRIQIPLTGSNYIYCTNAYEVDAFKSLSKLKDIQYCKINKRVLDKVKALPNWFSPKEYIDKSVQSINADAIEDTFYNTNVKNANRMARLVLKEKEVKLKEEEAIVLKEAISIGLVQPKKQIDVSKDLWKKYPLLKYISDHYYDDVKSHVKKYIQLIDGETQ